MVLASGPLTSQEPDHCCQELSLPAEICGGGHGTGLTTIDGASAYAGIIGRCQFATIATPTRNYAIYLYVGSDRLRATYDPDWFQAVLDTVDLRPEQAVDAR